MSSQHRRSSLPSSSGGIPSNSKAPRRSSLNNGSMARRSSLKNGTMARRSSLSRRRSSIASNASSDTTDDNLSVSFHNQTRYREAKHTISPEDIEYIWYSKEDFEAFKDEGIAIAKSSMKRPQGRRASIGPCEDVCHRGLEKYLAKAGNTKYSNEKSTRQACLFAVELEVSNPFSNSKMIARASEKATSTAREAARKRGIEDEKVVKDMYRENRGFWGFRSMAQVGAMQKRGSM